MGKKGARKESEDSDRKKDKDKGGKRRARPPDLPLMDLVEGCPPHGRLVFEWVVGNGIGDAAVEDAQAAYERAFEVRRARVEDQARREEAEDSDRKGDEVVCRIRSRMVMGPVNGQQSWRIDEDPVRRATTWNWVGFFVIEDRSWS